MQAQVIRRDAKITLLRRAQLVASGLVLAMVAATYVMRLAQGARWPLSHPYPALSLVPIALLIVLFGRRSPLGFALMAAVMVVSASLWFFANLQAL
jgi:hypothetical protein